MQEKVFYSLSWEDPRLILKALSLSKKDHVIAVASGGEHVFALLHHQLKRIIAIDSNASQIKLLRLKLAALQHLDFDSFTRFLGYGASEKRWDYFLMCSKNLPQEDVFFWRENKKSVQEGIIHMGRFEKYLHLFRKYILPRAHSKREIDELFNLSFQDQEIFYDQIWNNARWRFLFRIFFSKLLLQRGRKKDYFCYSNIPDIAQHYFQRTAYALTQIPIKDNYFLHFIVSGNVSLPWKGHPYLDERNFDLAKKRIEKVTFVHDTVLSFLQQTPDHFSRYHLSDIFESVSQEDYEKILLALARTAKKGSRICYWNNLAARFEHPSVQKIRPLHKLSDQLFKEDRAFFYSKFIVESVQ